MRKFVVLFTLCTMAQGVLAHEHQSLSNYAKLAKQTKLDIQTHSFDHIAQASRALVDLAKQVIPQFSQNNPVCQTYLTAVMNAAESMQQLSLAEIEADYHRDGKLPPLTDGACYHAKDLLVHPATVVVMTQTTPDNPKNRQKMTNELVEVIAHLSMVEQAIEIKQP